MIEKTIELESSGDDQGGEFPAKFERWRTYEELLNCPASNFVADIAVTVFCVAERTEPDKRSLRSLLRNTIFLFP